MKLPGLCVPPGPLVAYAESPHSVLSGAKPLTADMEVSLMDTMQAFLDRSRSLSAAAADAAEALCEDRPLSAALKAKREAAAKKAVPLREGAHAFLRVCADERAWLATAQEALNMHEWCRRESATARRHLREHVASRDEREIQLRRAASRASESSDYGAQLASWAEQSHADAMLDGRDAAAATLAEDRLRARLVAAAALVHEELAKLQAFGARGSRRRCWPTRGPDVPARRLRSIYAPRSAEDAAVAVAVPDEAEGVVAVPEESEGAFDNAGSPGGKNPSTTRRPRCRGARGRRRRAKGDEPPPVAAPADPVGETVDL
ncbi:hypothetical protein JL722_9348 [Aureococcus anophagefferens]|nr:hypothetical protein JL722_9348 [Aureococcus anophagefferens]